MGVPRWLQILGQIGPQILAFTPLAPIAPAVAAAIGEAEAIGGASSAQKLAHVQQIVNDAVIATNAQAGKTVLDPQLVAAASATAISTVVNVTNVVHAAHDATHAATDQPADSK